MVITSQTAIQLVYDEDCGSGIVKCAQKVKKDIGGVFGTADSTDTLRIVFGIAGVSHVIDGYCTDTSEIQGKREVYGFFVNEKENALIIAGSDKRGTIYGLFHISEMFGVSPFTDWSGVPYPHRDSFEFTEKDSFVSKEPSVEYRGFFINDEWPAFGNWCMKHFGGVNAKMYEHIFELLLRLKGNYLWPAMWASCFACDGPGLEAAELADEYGVVMGLSHHEPCLRHGEEYSHLRGKDSIYGDAWNFRLNPDGITRFWDDGLKRNGHLENVITVGMRGERDSAILGNNSTLESNISLLRDVLKVQNELIRKNVNEDLDSVPRMLAVYKEVEAFYYGDENTVGLRDCSELDNVIIMLCDDNHGYLRSLPDDEMRKHRGGFGMYYHFDYHGDPVSYEWVNSTYLPEVWEQMTVCYEKGVKRLWIVNVGDLGLNEMPLSYFLDLAYDYDKWGKSYSPDEYTEKWMRASFGAVLSDDDITALAAMHKEYTRLVHSRRPEHMSADIYSVRCCDEAARVLERIESIRSECIRIGQKLPVEYRTAYTGLISYNVLAGLNNIEMWINSAYNRHFAKLGLIAADQYAQKVRECLAEDARLREELHTTGNGRFDGFGLAPHIGFKNWNSEESVNPTLEYVIPVDRADIKAGLICENGETSGHEWTGRTLEMRRFVPVKNGRRYSGFFTALMGTVPVKYTVECDKEWLLLDEKCGELTADEPIKRHYVRIDEDKLSASGEQITTDKAVITVKYDTGTIRINVYASAAGNGNAYHEENGIICVNAEHFAENKSVGGCGFEAFADMGLTSGAVRISPDMAIPQDEKPFVRYDVYTADAGDFKLIFDLQPNNPYIYGRDIELAYSVNKGEIQYRQVTGAENLAGSGRMWADGVLRHIRKAECNIRLEKGANSIYFYGICHENVLERLTLIRNGEDDHAVTGAYFGAPESV